MPDATSLRDLLRIRSANRAYISTINGNLGSALGFKRRSGVELSAGVPAVIIFVPQKINARWLPAGQVIRTELIGPDDLRCPVDVVEGGRYEQRSDRRFLGVTNTGIPFITLQQQLKAEAPLSEGQRGILEILRGWSEKITLGSQLAGRDESGNAYIGSLGCFCRRLDDGTIGFLTNKHVGAHVGNILRYPIHEARAIGTVKSLFEYVPDEARFPGMVDEPNSSYKVDCAFVELNKELSLAQIDPRMVVLEGAEIAMRQLGTPLALDINTMGPIGERVISVGRTRSFQKGSITAFGYEWAAVGSQSAFTDYLIVGDSPDEFSDSGDSGKLIVTENGLHPIALGWGGRQERLRSGFSQENWTYALDINMALRLLNLEIITSV